ncbi:MAG: hypothetical protein R3321_05980, partial [Nitrososphaeraceae archaeon]|nr:hypothetical protein [Nitrososphaeraceae archaeon]
MIKTTEYYEDFLNYHAKSSQMQREANIGNTPHGEVKVGDDLMNNFRLYDAVDRKIEGHSQILHDVFYGTSDQHTYYHKPYHKDRKEVTEKWAGKQEVFGIKEWLYVFLLHRLTGSGVHYGKDKSGYHNSIFFHIHECNSIPEMAEFIKNYRQPFYTSIGYQFPSFPKPPEGYIRGGDYYFAEIAPKLIDDLMDFLDEHAPCDFRTIGDWMLEWNRSHGLRRYFF